MNIKNFSKDRIDLNNKTYESELFNKTFQLYHFPSESPSDRAVINLESLTKQEIKENLPGFIKSLPGKNFNVPFNDSEEFYKNSSYHQIYRFITDNQNCRLRIFFHDRAETFVINNFINALLECILLSENSNSFNPYEQLNQQSKELYQDLCSKIQKITDKSRESIRFDDKIKHDYINNKILMVLNAIQISSMKKQDIEELLKIRIFPLIPNDNDAVIKAIID